VQIRACIAPLHYIGIVLSLYLYNQRYNQLKLVEHLHLENNMKLKGTPPPGRAIVICRIFAVSSDMCRGHRSGSRVAGGDQKLKMLSSIINILRY